ncbi:MAG: MaoC family dehydratase N-terminal domain-containing protein [Promethearchaeia archaeon]
MDKETIKRNAEFLQKKLPGMKIPGKVKFHCRYKHMVEFAKCFDLTDPKYIGPDEDKIIACPAFANAFSAKLYVNMATIQFEQNGKTRGFLLDFKKLLHAANEYDWEDCVKIRAGDKLTMEGEIGDIWVNEKMRLFGEIFQRVKNQNGELVCKVKTIATIAPGGY